MFKLCISILIFSVFFHVSFSQSVNNTIKLAENMYESSELELSLKYYKRAAFFSDKNNKQEIYLKIANLLFEKNNISETQNYLDSSLLYCLNDSLKTLILHHKAEVYIIDLQFSNAKNIVDECVNNYEKDTLITSRLYYSIIFFGLKKYELAEKNFLNLLPDSAIVGRAKIKGIFKKNKFLKHSGYKFAKAISIIIPGGGMVYLGNYKNGLNSLLLVGGITFMGVNMASKVSIFNSVVSVFPWFLRYYKSNITKTTKFAFKKYNNKRNNVFNEILEVLAVYY